MGELLNPRTFKVPVLPSYRGMPEDQQPAFVFRARTWRETIELDEITAEFRDCETDGPIAELMAPAIRKHLVAEESADIEKLTYMELVELFVSMRECESIELRVKKNLLLQSPSGTEKSAEEDAETAPDPKSSSSTVPAAAEKDAPTATSEAPST